MTDDELLKETETERVEWDVESFFNSLTKNEKLKLIDHLQKIYKEEIND